MDACDNYGRESSIEKVYHYNPYGEVVFESLSSGPVNLYQYSGKEWDDKQKAYDFSARMYMPGIARFSTMDPLCEQDPGHSPYLYCAGNPVNLVDPDGRSTNVKKLEDGTYEVIGGTLDDDLNIYVYSPDENGEFSIRGKSIGVTTSNTSFYNSDVDVDGDGIADGSWAVGSKIDLNDSSGKEFLNYVADANLPLELYAMYATPHNILDFKYSNGGFGKAVGGPYRGMPVGMNKDGKAIITSARDIGNMAAGYEAGINGLSWSTTRTCFDALQKIEDLKFRVKEGISSQNAQMIGWSIGNTKYRRKK